MQDKLIDFKTAKLAKKKGFNIIQWYSNIASLYSKEGNHSYYMNYGRMYSGLSDGYISAPTQNLLKAWLREEHKIDILVAPVGDNSPSLNTIGYYGEICRDMSQNNIETDTKETYEEAFEEVLLKALKLIK
jgi:hypothetical protein